MSRKSALTPLTARVRQERLYTILMAQKVAEGSKTIREEEKTNLNRYANWHFQRTFDRMVEECKEMAEWNSEQTATQD